jgi:hypothetical protein
MKSHPYNCEKHCVGQSQVTAPKLIVLTGGPGAGKTALLEFVRKVFCEHVAILPEAASILFSGGFWRLESDNAKKAAQRAIYHVQTEMQNLIMNEGKWAVGLCDRGTLDGAAYWPGHYSSFCEDLGVSFEDEYAKYLAVIHLSTPALHNGYNHQNPIRIETAAEAARIDERIHDIWKNHPHYLEVESTGNFIEKVNQATSLIKNFLPECCGEHLKVASK